MDRITVDKIENKNNTFVLRLSTDDTDQIFNSIEDVVAHVENAVETFYGESSSNGLKNTLSEIVKFRLGVMPEEIKGDEFMANVYMADLRRNYERLHLYMY